MPDHLVLYNTLTRKAEAFRPRDPRRITFYTCGPTVYDDAHIGNFRSFLAADVLRRFLESPLCKLVNEGGNGSHAPAAPEPGSESRATQRTVLHVMNITDVGHMTDDDAADGAGEDKMAAATRRLSEAKKSGKLPPGAGDIDPTDQHAIARFYEVRFLEDARRLGLKVAIDAQRDPTLMPRATAAVPGMIAVIERLIARGHAYAVGPAGRQTIYFSVPSFPAYGSLSGNTLDALRAGQGGRVLEAHQAEKKHPADFLLWKSDPTHAMRWQSPWGEGYPGWHIECTAMAAARLCAADDGSSGPASPLTPAALGALDVADARPMIDLHSGGEDNIFPHHECEIAQSCGAFNASPADAAPARGMFAAHWFHPRFLMVEGAKMSKSKGNFFTPRDLFARGHEPAAVRLELIKTHYRSNANFTEQGLKDSARMFRRWLRRLYVFSESPGNEIVSAHIKNVRQITDLTAEYRSKFSDAMHQDLNVAAAIAIVQEFLDRIGTAINSVDSEQDRFRLLPSFVNDRLLKLEPRSHPLVQALQWCREMIVSLGLFHCDDPPPLKAVALTRDQLQSLAAASDSELGAKVFELVPDTDWPSFKQWTQALTLTVRRYAAKATRDFARADEIRDELVRMGFVVEDRSGGAVEVRKPAN